MSNLKIKKKALYDVYSALLLLLCSQQFAKDSLCYKCCDTFR